jgi:hypothetical protein
MEACAALELLRKNSHEATTFRLQAESEWPRLAAV